MLVWHFQTRYLLFVWQLTSHISCISVQILVEDVPLVIDWQVSYSVIYVSQRMLWEYQHNSRRACSTGGEWEISDVFILPTTRREIEAVSSHRVTRHLIFNDFLFLPLAFSLFFRTKFFSLNFVASRTFLWQHLSLKPDFITTLSLKEKSSLSFSYRSQTLLLLWCRAPLSLHCRSELYFESVTIGFYNILVRILKTK